MTASRTSIRGATIALLLVASSAGIARAETIRLDVPAGYSGRLWSFYAYNQDTCADVAIRGHSVLRQPKHGTVSLRIEPKRETRKGKKCFGKSFKALYVYFRAKGRYKGGDAFEVRARHTFNASERNMVSQRVRFVLDLK
ncbi:hypothetical protein [Breoghania sp. L-A4]|uniref:hypothetical protein n=1 Tax=Breoghania sp. L-A4 TaxID=2304600 RepID=UPI000E35B84C|nr:hypothetical protein [Breoghania sp. L-A4]AXS42081.1 hypothetical protein D1F64_21355 [Breoghania sp. L-A4]